MDRLFIFVEADNQWCYLMIEYPLPDLNKLICWQNLLKVRIMQINQLIRTLVGGRFIVPIADLSASVDVPA
jgi:hypothetical protein